MAKKKVVLDKTAQDLVKEKRKADQLFFMALHRRKRAKEALEIYLKSTLPPKVEPVIQTDLFGYVQSEFPF
jgi:hypothetical protein